MLTTLIIDEIFSSFIPELSDHVHSETVNICEEGSEDEVLSETDHDLCNDLDNQDSLFINDPVSEADVSPVELEEPVSSFRHASLKNYPVSEYEKIRNRIIAEREALFQLMNPTFNDELKVLKGVIKRKKAAPKCTDNVPSRKSNRIRNRKVNEEANISNERSEISNRESNSDNLELESVETCSPHEQGDDTLDEEVGQEEILVTADWTVGCSDAEVQDEEELDVDYVEYASINAPRNESVDNIPMSDVGRFGCNPCGMTFRYI